MSASKAVLSFSKSIVVDTGETAGLPDLVKEAYRRGGASIPIVIFVDPGMKNIYGSFNHPAMKAQNYGEIFKDAKDSIRKAQREGSFAFTDKEPVLVKVANASVESWKSAQGSEIKAKLVGIEDETTYLFETEDGKTIRATANQLDKESVAKARKAAGLK
ncbi:hypothetical protein V2O64_20665 [Verrucomicrobiaceae bacterium 227]